MSDGERWTLKTVWGLADGPVMFTRDEYARWKAGDDAALVEAMADQGRRQPPGTRYPED